MDDDDDEFQINNMHFQEDEVKMMDQRLQLKGAKTANNSRISDNKSMISDLNQAFVDKSRIDTSNLMDDGGSILGQLHLNKSNISTYECSRCKKLMFENQKQAQIISDLQKLSKEKQNLFDSFGALRKEEHEHTEESKEQKLDIKDDAVLSGSHVREPKTLELSSEILELEKSIGKIHNRTLSFIKYPKDNNRMESPMRPDEIIGV